MITQPLSGMRWQGVNVRIMHDLPSALTEQLMCRIAGMGANAVALVTSEYAEVDPSDNNQIVPARFIPHKLIWSDRGQAPGLWKNTPTLATMARIARQARKHDLQVAWKKHIDLVYWHRGDGRYYPAGWRGYLHIGDQVDKWTDEYRKMILAPCLQLSTGRDELIFLGTELYTVTKELGAAWWRDQATWLGPQHDGPITYDANWGWADDAEYARLAPLWPMLDYMAVSAYFPLTSAPSAPDDVDALTAGWHRRGIDADWCLPIDDHLESIALTAGRPLIFGEIGIGNRKGAAAQPSADPDGSSEPDEGIQQRYAEAFHRKWDGRFNFRGAFWWEASPIGLQPISHNVLGRPLERTLWPVAPYGGV